MAGSILFFFSIIANSKYIIEEPEIKMKYIEEWK